MELQVRSKRMAALTREDNMSGRITPTQIRGARGMLDWSIPDLAVAAGLSISTIKRMEMAGSQPISKDAFAMTRAALEAAGVRFLSDTGEGIGVRLRAR